MIKLSSEELTEMAALAAEDESVEETQISDEEIAELEKGYIGCRCYQLLDRMRTAEARVRELEASIRKHRGQLGHDQCWENDIELYEVLNDGGDNLGPHRSLPCREEFMTRCKEYYESRLVPLRKNHDAT